MNGNLLVLLLASGAIAGKALSPVLLGRLKWFTYGFFFTGIMLSLALLLPPTFADPIFSRIQYGAGHTLDWLLLVVSVTVLAPALRNPVDAVYITGFFVAVHELLWWLLYHQNVLPAVPYLSLMCVLLVAGFRQAMGARLKSGSTLALLLLGSYFLAWYISGFPVTVNSSGPTAYYDSYAVNMIEHVSWLPLLIPSGYAALQRLGAKQ
jgi:hypothetical protein